MKSVILLFVIFSAFNPTNAQAFQQTSAINCNYCSVQGKQVRAQTAAFIDGQKIWIIDQQGNDFIIDEYRAFQQNNGEVGQVDDFYVELISTHNKSSALSSTVKNAFIASRDAIQYIDESISTIELAANDEFESGFQIASYPQQFAGMMSNRIMNDPTVKEQFVIIDAQNQTLKANLSISLPFIGTTLNLSSQLIILFTDGTSAEMNIGLATVNGTKVKIVLSLKHVLDKQGNIIPTVSSGLGSYRSGEELSASNTGHMGHFVDWWHQLEVRGVQVITNGGYTGGGSTSIKDCEYVIERKANGEAVARLICK
ncbi:hypothetical protein [Thalassotalea sediminis]|uniref:hypothetical protein n=1 Tax=Thalassotalea sediminis TaxID=1759089 RepID=UPI002573E179|nr:hypothetical protein [Thalassotalea sediminis]